MKQTDKSMKDSDTILGQRTCAVLDLPEETDAGAAFSLRFEVNYDPPVEKSGQKLEIVSSTGDIVAASTLDPAAESNGNSWTADVSLVAPGVAGRHEFVVRMCSHDSGGVAYPEVVQGFTVAVVAHQISPVVWGVPSAISRGTAFPAKIGARCTSDCATSGWKVQVRDHNGEVVAETETGTALWQGTSGLYYAEIDLDAPDEVGLFEWNASVEASGSDLPHMAGVRKFGVRITPPADSTLHVEAVDRESGAPIEGLKVVAHPFNALTGSDGTAVINLPSDTYRVMVSGKGYVPRSVEGKVEGNENLRVELEQDIGPTDADYWA